MKKKGLTFFAFIVLLAVLIVFIFLLGIKDLGKETGSTTSVNDHIHGYRVDKEGNGETSYNEAHKHIITNFIVQEAHGHIHELVR